MKLIATAAPSQTLSVAIVKVMLVAGTPSNIFLWQKVEAFPVVNGSSAQAFQMGL